MTVDEKRRLLILYYINSGNNHLATEIDPDKYPADLKVLEKEGLIKNKKTTPKGKKAISKITPEKIRRIKRIFFSNQ